MAWLDDFLSESDQQVVDEIVAAAELPDISRPPLPFDIWNSSKYRILIANRITSLGSDSEYWSQYLADLRVASMTYVATSNLICGLQFGPAPLALARNGLYPAAYGFMQAAKAGGFELAYLDGGIHSRRILNSVWVAPSPRELLDTAGLPCEARAMQAPLSSTKLSSMTDHLEDLQFGRSLRGYSAGGELVGATIVRSQLGIPQDAPVLTLLTSSQDEVAAGALVGALPARFSKAPSHDEWLEDTLAHWGKSDPVLIVRIHPRLGRSGPSGASAPQLMQIVTMVKSLRKPNVILDHPDQSTPLRHLVAISDGCLNFQSTAGLEFLAQGVPVVHQFPDACLPYSPVSLALPENWRNILTDPDPDFMAGEAGLRTIRALRWWSEVVSSSSVQLTRGSDATRAEVPRQPSLGSRISTLSRDVALSSLRRSYRLESMVRARRNARAIEQLHRGALDYRDVQDALGGRLTNFSSDAIATSPPEDSGIYEGEIDLLRQFALQIAAWHPRTRSGMGAIVRFLEWAEA